MVETKKETKTVTNPQNLDWLLIKPRITEKAAMQIEGNKYTFLVNPRANRSQVKQAVAAAYKVTPLKVNIMLQPSRLVKRWGKKVMDRGYKKAVVTLAANESIELV